MDTAAIVVVAIGLVGALAIPLRRLLKSDSSAAPKSDAAGDNGDSDEKPKAATFNIESIREDLKSIRADLGSYGTAIGVASSGLKAAATLTALDDLFPFPAHWWGWFLPHRGCYRRNSLCRYLGKPDGFVLPREAAHPA
jgi:hypothetical protein